MRLYEYGALSSVVGALALALSKIRYNLKGYTPRRKRPRGMDEEPLYEMRQVDAWTCAIADVAPDFLLEGCSVLELGPGLSLGTGVLITALGAANYTAYDIHDLATQQPIDRYRRLLRRYAEQGRAVPTELPAEIERALMRAAASEAHRAAPIRFVTSNNFDFSEFEPGSIDLVVSTAAFEHFRDPGKAIADLTRICRPGAVFYALVDLKTHGRWIRDRDPLNIYRFHDFLYRPLSTSATPNRVRPQAYAAALEIAGWTDIRMRSMRDADAAYVAAVRDHIQPGFRDDWLQCLSLMVTARLSAGNANSGSQ